MATDADSLGRFAVEEHNKKENAKLQFVRAYNLTKQVVVGTEYSFNVDATDGQIKKQYVAKVLDMMGLKELVEFNTKA